MNAGQERMRRSVKQDWGTNVGEEAEDTTGRSGAAATSDRTRSAAGAKSARKRNMKAATYKQEMRPVIERLVGQMELIILT